MAYKDWKEPQLALESLWQSYTAQYEVEKKEFDLLEANGLFKQRVAALLKALELIKTTWWGFSVDERKWLVDFGLDSFSESEGLFLDYESLIESPNLHGDRLMRDMALVNARLRTKLERDIRSLKGLIDWKLGNSLDRLNKQLVLELLQLSMRANNDNPPTKYDKHPAIKFVEGAVLKLQEHAIKKHKDHPATKALSKFEAVASACRTVIKDNILGKKALHIF
jgi:hypothetical protein